MIRTRDLEWAAGFLDGEGWFGLQTGKVPSPEIAANQKDTWALARLQKIFGGSVTLQGRGKNTKPHYKPSYRWVVTARRAAAAMMTLYSLLSPYRQGQISGALKLWRDVTRNPGWVWRDYKNDEIVVWSDPRRPECYSGPDKNIRRKLCPSYGNKYRKTA